MRDYIIGTQQEEYNNENYNNNLIRIKINLPVFAVHDV